MRNSERRLISRPKYRKTLEDNPRTTEVGGEDVALRPLDTFALPRRRKLLARALNLIRQGDGQDWANIPPLLNGMFGGVKKLPPNEGWIQKVVTTAVSAGKTGMIVQCLQQPDRTGLSVKDDQILNTLLVGLHQTAQADGWSKEATEKALKEANAISLIMDSASQGFGGEVATNDPRARSEVLGVFLELSAVFALKHQDGKDVNGVVKAYVERLLNRLEAQTAGVRLAVLDAEDHARHALTESQTEVALEERGRQFSMLFAISIWQGLRAAQTVLGSEMPKAKHAERLMIRYKTALETAAKQLESRTDTPGYYDAEALAAWKDAVRD